MGEKIEENQNKIAKNSEMKRRGLLLQGDLLLTEKATVPSGRASQDSRRKAEKKTGKIRRKFAKKSK